MEELRPKPRRKTIAAAVTLLIGLLVYALNNGAVKSNLAKVQTLQPGLYHVDKAVDGDTLDVSQGGHKDTVRLIGMDTPETHDPRKPVQCFGQAAADYTRQLVEGKNVRLEADPADSDRDKYHRLLRYVYLPDGTFLNQQLTQQGYAFAYTVFPNSKLDQFRQWEDEARQNNRGLWAGCNVDASQQIKQTAGTKT